MSYLSSAKNFDRFRALDELNPMSRSRDMTTNVSSKVREQSEIMCGSNLLSYTPPSGRQGDSHLSFMTRGIFHSELQSEMTRVSGFHSAIPCFSEMSRGGYVPQ